MKETRIRNDDKVQIGTNIKRIRMQKKLKTSDLVIKIQLAGVDINLFVLCKIEANTQHIKASQFRAIAEALEVDCMDLLADYGEGLEER